MWCVCVCVDSVAEQSSCLVFYENAVQNLESHVLCAAFLIFLNSKRRASTIPPPTTEIFVCVVVVVNCFRERYGWKQWDALRLSSNRSSLFRVVSCRS